MVTMTAEELDRLIYIIQMYGRNYDDMTLDMVQNAADLADEYGYELKKAGYERKWPM